MRRRRNTNFALRTTNRAPRNMRRALARQSKRAVLRFVNGVDWVTRDPNRLLDQTPYEVVARREKMTLRRYLPLDEGAMELGTEMITAARRTHGTPVLLIPPLMVKPFIYDLVPKRSYVRTLMAAGFDVYLIDFGEPERQDRYMTLDHYVLDWIPHAVDAMCRESRAESISMIGYCMGGLFALMHTSVNEDPRVRNIVTIGSPVDSDEMGVIVWLMRLAHDQIEFVSRRLGNIPGDLSSAAFKMITPMRNFTRYGHLFVNLWNEEYVNDFDALNQWSNQFVDYPGKAFRQLLNEFLVGNKLADGSMTFGGKLADLSRVTCPVLAFAGSTDQIVPESAIRRILELVGSEDRQVQVVPGGHMGMFGGRHAPDKVWGHSARWLVGSISSRSASLRAN